jgi:hypothetical protein
MLLTVLQPGRYLSKKPFRVINWDGSLESFDMALLIIAPLSTKAQPEITILGVLLKIKPCSV